MNKTLKIFLTWALIFSFTILFGIGYWQMVIDVNSDKCEQEVTTKNAKLNQKRFERDLKRFENNQLETKLINEMIILLAKKELEVKKAIADSRLETTKEQMILIKEICQLQFKVFELEEKLQTNNQHWWFQ